MEIKHLTSFLQVASVQNFTKAAELLGYSQSNISVHIQQLEEELGVPLFHRIARSVVLTPYGEALIPYARECLASARKIEGLFQSDELLTGTLHVGFTESLFETFFEAIITPFHEQFPRIDIDVTVDATSVLLQKLSSGELNLGLIIDLPQDHPNLIAHVQKNCSTHLVASASHPLATRSRIRPSDLADQEFILTEANSPYNVSFQQYLIEHDTAVRSYLKLQSTSMILSLLRHGRYLSVLPDYVIRDELAAGTITKLDLPHYRGTQTIELLAHRNTILTPPLGSFVERANMCIEQQS